MKKVFLIVGFGLLVLIVVILVTLGFYLGPIVKLGIERVGPQVAQVSVKVDSVNISLLAGSASIKGLVVGNPQGFTSEQAISVGNIVINLDPSSVLSSKILIRSVQVQSPEITYEGGFKGNNLSKILANVNAFTKNIQPASESVSSNSASSQSNNKSAPKIEVDDFLITGAKVHVNMEGLVNKDINLPDIHLTDLGKGSDGLTPVQLTSAVLKAIISDTITVVANTIGGIGNSFTKVVGSIGSLFGK